MKSKNILIVRNASAKDFGGGERYPVYLAEELKLLNYNAIVFSGHEKIKKLCNKRKVNFKKMPWSPIQNYSGVRFILVPFYFIWQLYLLIWFMLTIIKYSSEVVHLQSKDDFIAGTIAAKILRRRVVWTDHADLKYILQNTNMLFKNPVGKLVGYTSRFADKVIIVSKNELKLISDYSGRKNPNNYVVIYNGVADEKVNPIRNFDKKTVLFVTTSRLVKPKGIYELIEASKKLADEGYNFRTLLLGEGPEEKNMKEKAKECVLFLGFPDNYLSIVKGSDVFIHPSYNEGFSVSLVEAAMLSMPVIATNVGGNPEIIKDKKTGILINPKNSGELYDAMKYAINNTPSIRSMGYLLRKDYEKRFIFNKIVKDQVIPIYEGRA